jgi:hypothetical protein
MGCFFTTKYWNHMKQWRIGLMEWWISFAAFAPVA